MSLDILDRVKLVSFYYRCKLLYLTDIVPLVIQYIIKTQHYERYIKYKYYSIQNILVETLTITEHTTYLLLQMLLNKYTDFDNILKLSLQKIHISTIKLTELIITNCVINNNMITLTLNLKHYTPVSYGVSNNYIWYDANCAELGDFVLEL